MIRPILSLKRLSIDKAKGKVCYQYGKDSSGLEQMDYLEFIARVTSHIPDKGQVMIRYYGLYANAHRGKINKAGVLLSHPPIIGEEERFVQDYRSPQTHLHGRTASPSSTCPAGTLDGSRRERGVFLSIGNRVIHN